MSRAWTGGVSPFTFLCSGDSVLGVSLWPSQVHGVEPQKQIGVVAWSPGWGGAAFLLARSAPQWTLKGTLGSRSALIPQRTEGFCSQRRDSAVLKIAAPRLRTSFDIRCFWDFLHPIIVIKYIYLYSYGCYSSFCGQLVSVELNSCAFQLSS